MDREALQTMYSVAVDEGYGGDLGEFFTLIQTNPEALDTVYMLAKKEGYKQSMATFELLLGLKKKRRSFSRLIRFRISKLKFAFGFKISW